MSFLKNEIFEELKIDVGEISKLIHEALPKEFELKS